MSWFSREWDGVHREGCSWEDTEDIEHNSDGEHSWARSIKSGEKVIMNGAGALFIAGDESQHDCTCPQLMIQAMIP